MMPQLAPFATLLSILWFLAYWILGGVFFAAVALTRLGRLHKVTFSCLFSILALACGIGASFGGLRYASHEVVRCLAFADSRAEALTAIFGCGFAGVFGAFLLGAVVLIVGGFISLFLASAKSPALEAIQESMSDPGEEPQNPSTLGTH